MTARDTYRCWTITTSPTPGGIYDWRGKVPDCVELGDLDMILAASREELVAAIDKWMEAADDRS